MNRTAVTLIMLMVAAAAAHAQRTEPPGRRQFLQGQIFDRFVTHASTQMGLDTDSRDKLQQHLREAGRQRRQLAVKSFELRRRMIESVRDSAASDAEFRRLLTDAMALRQREDELWKSEQEALSRFLTPRQQVQFVFMWLRFNEQIREMALRPPSPPGRPRPH